MKSNELDRQKWRHGIYECLAAEGNDHERCCEITAKFDQLTENNGMGAEFSAGILFNAYAKTDSKQLLNHVGRWIHSELETFNAAFPKITLDSKQRLKKVIESLNSKISQCCITVDGKDVSPESAAAAKVKMPDCLKNPTLFEARASEKAKANFSLEVTL